MADILLSISLGICWIVIIAMQQKHKKLKDQVWDQKLLINDLYRIFDERLLQSETDGE